MTIFNIICLSLVIHIGLNAQCIMRALAYLKSIYSFKRYSVELHLVTLPSNVTPVMIPSENIPPPALGPMRLYSCILQNNFKLLGIFAARKMFWVDIVSFSLVKN